VIFGKLLNNCWKIEERLLHDF